MIIDILVVGVYFFDDIFFCVFGYRVLVVNLSDLVVMGVEFIWILVGLILFEVNMEWIE